MSTTALIQGEQAAQKSIFRLLFLGLLKLFAGVFTGMSVMIADAISTFADTLGIFAAYLGLRLSRKHADSNFEYGYYKIETLAALLISVGIVILSFFIFKQSVSTFLHPPVGEHRVLALTATLFAIYNSRRLERNLRIAGEKANSLALLASAKDKKMDVFSGIAVLISIAANYNGIPYVEGTVSGILAFLVFKVGYSSAKESLFFLLDYWDDPKLKNQIKKIIRSEKDIIVNIRKLRLRRAGTFIFGETFVEINPFVEVKDLRDELKILQKKISELNPYIKDFSIYTHIKKDAKAKVAIPLSSGKNLSGKVANTLKTTEGYLFVTVKDSKIKDSYYRKLPVKCQNTIELGKFLKKEKIQIVIDNKINSLLYYNLRRTHQILIYPNFSDIKSAQKTIELLLLDS